MYRLAWLTDVHLNFLKPDGLAAFYARAVARQPDGLVITGDVAEAHNLERHLLELDTHLNLPIYFVLGNHDFYRGSIAEVRDLARRLTAASRHLRWLPACGVVSLTPQVGLVGHDGWADGRAADFLASSIRLNDYVLIRDLAGLSDQRLLERLNALGDEAAAYARAVLPEALAKHEHVVFATHPPPFREAAWYLGRNSGPDWQPHLVCLALGEALVAIMQDHPQRRLTVLCGHTHGEGTTQPLPNLLVRTGGATYGDPRVQEIFAFA